MGKKRCRWKTRLREWCGDAALNNPTASAARDWRDPHERQRHVAYYSPERDAIRISERHPHGKAIWWHEQAHRLMCRNLGQKAFSRSRVDAEMRADAVACAMVGTDTYLKCMEFMRKACEERMNRRAAVIGRPLRVDRLNLQDMEKRIAFIRENVHIQG